MRRLIFLFLLLPICMAGQEAWCPEPTHRLVNDYSGMLTTSQREALEQRLVEFDNSTSNQILIVITPTMHGEEIMELATRIGTTWGVGQKEVDNGVVILIKSKTEEENWGDVAIAPGYGLEGALPDLFCKNIIEDYMLDSLAAGKYYHALTGALDVIEKVCKGEYSYAEYKKEAKRDLLLGTGICLLIFVGLFFLLRRVNISSGGSGSTDGGSSYGGSSWGGPHFGGGSWGGGSSFGGFGGGSFGGGGAHGRF